VSLPTVGSKPADARGTTAILASLASWALLLVASRALILSFGFDPFAFAFVQMGAGGLFMMWVGRSTGEARSIVSSPLTWLYGILRVSTAGFFTAALVHTSAANAAFLGIVSVPLAALALRTIFGRRLSAWELPGHALVLVGLALVSTGLDGGLANPAVVLMLMSELSVVGAPIIAEFHPVNRGSDERSRAFLSGVVLLVSAAALTLLLAMMSVLVPAFAIGGLEAISNGLADWRLWAAAILLGVVARGPSIYLSLKAVKLAGAMTYVAAMALLPLFAFAVEAGFAGFGLMPAEPLDGWLLASGLLASAGSLTVVLARSRALTR